MGHMEHFYGEFLFDIFVPLLTVDFCYIENSNMNILINISFCVPWKRASLKERHGGE